MNIDTRQNNTDLVDNAEASARMAAKELAGNITKNNIKIAKKLLKRALFLLSKIKS